MPEEGLVVKITGDNSGLKNSVKESKSVLATLPDKVTVQYDEAIQKEIQAVTQEAKELTEIFSTRIKGGLFDNEDVKLTVSYMERLQDVLGKININDGSPLTAELTSSATNLAQLLETGTIDTSSIDRATQSTQALTGETYDAAQATGGVYRSTLAVQDAWAGATNGVRSYIQSIGQIPDISSPDFDPKQYSNDFQALYEQYSSLEKYLNDYKNGEIEVDSDYINDVYKQYYAAFRDASNRAMAEAMLTGGNGTTPQQQTQQNQRNTSSSNDIGKTIKQVVGSLTGFATIFALIRKIATQNEALTNAISRFVSTISEILSPVFNWLANLITTVTTWLAKALGYEVKTAKATTSVAKSLASFDEINNLSTSSGTTSSGTSVVKVKELEDFDGVADDILNKIEDVYGEDSKIYQWLKNNVTTNEEGEVENPYTYRQRKVFGLGNQNDSEGGLIDWVKKIWENQTTTTQQQITAQQTIVDAQVTSINDKLETIRKIFSGEGATGEDSPYSYRNRSVFGLGDQNGTIDWESVWERIKTSVAYGFAQGVSDKSLMDDLEQRMYNAQLKAMSKAKQTINFSVDGKNLAQTVLNRLGYANEIKGVYLTN